MATKRERLRRKKAIEYCNRSAEANRMSLQWFKKYLAAGEITPELEIERDRIMSVITGCSYQRQR